MWKIQFLYTQMLRIYKWPKFQNFAFKEYVVEVSAHVFFSFLYLKKCKIQIFVWTWIDMCCQLTTWQHAEDASDE